MAMANAGKWKVILLDIEGTTTSISFVKETLFPFAAENVEHFLKENWLEEDVQEIVVQLNNEYQSDLKNGVPGVESILEPQSNLESKLDDQQSVVKYVLWQISQDLKRTPLKALQGKIWKSGFEKGQLAGHVFEDVPDAFQRIVDSDRKICIYSSGSVEAQKLLFRYSAAGDLGKFLSGYFDTNVGPKIESQSYKNITSSLGIDPEEILFITDVPKEAYAAREASMDVAVMIRPGNVPLSATDLEAFKTMNDFSELVF